MDGAPVEAGGDTSKVFEFIETAFDSVANFIGFKVVGDWPLSRWIARDDGFGAHAANQVSQCVGVISFVCQHSAGR